ncbi:nucleotidyl transferase AbiEii/AbiGii toxin family protein [Sulfurovum sp.]|uniref:nucleotidyl transferase AbiEii/AbiGii toxin family protein n=1 Tax=Sulfurovum sp. TaxID=1969726 RepID=UPI002A35D7DA|nr:nucleotidyl transferase AbiEii/AbiGii toxin family protein [Sulfurovum sp.]MDY0402762.1 nucleotidyl transferase AbiEii/AbiGii toxin family protein [Sulfurovum sp.]
MRSTDTCWVSSMTASVKQVLTQISNNKIFDNELYFTGGTALAYYLNHRVSEDIDIVSSKTLNYKEIITAMTSLGAIKIQDENVTALRMAGFFPDEYMIKFVLDNVKLELFHANRPIQKEILSEATFESFENSRLKILDVKSVAKLKLVAFIMRDKSRDLFDFGAILKHKILTKNEIVEIVSKIKNNIVSTEDMIHFLKSKKEPIDDETVYFNEIDRIDLTFDEIKEQVMSNF